MVLNPECPLESLGSFPNIPLPRSPTQRLQFSWSGVQSHWCFLKLPDDPNMQPRLRITALNYAVHGDLSDKWIRMIALNLLINLIVTKNGRQPDIMRLLIQCNRKNKVPVMCQKTEPESNQGSRSNYQSTENMGSYNETVRGCNWPNLKCGKINRTKYHGLFNK